MPVTPVDGEVARRSATLRVQPNETAKRKLLMDQSDFDDRLEELRSVNAATLAILTAALSAQLSREQLHDDIAAIHQRVKDAGAAPPGLDSAIQQVLRLIGSHPRRPN